MLILRTDLSLDFCRGAVAQSLERLKGPNLAQLYREFESRRGIGVRKIILATPSVDDSPDINMRGLVA